MVFDQYKTIIERSLIAPEHSIIVERVLSRVRQARLARMRLLASLYGILTLVALALLEPAFSFLVKGLRTSGFSQYFNLAISTNASFWTIWKDLFLSLAESMPIIETTVVVAVIFMLAYSVRHIAKNLFDASEYKRQII